MAAASLLEAEIVTADGAVRIANACTNPDLFWGLKGGGGGSLGVVTRLTLRTHDLPDFVGAVNMTIKAASDVAFRRLIGRVVSFYSDSLFNPHWGEQIAFRPGNVLAIAMVFQGLDQQQAETIWRSVPRLAGRFSAGFQHRVSAMDRGCAGSALLGPWFSQGSPRRGACRRPAGRSRDQRVLGGQSGRSGTGPAWLSVGMASSLAPAAGPAGSSRRCPVCGEPALGRVSACQQGPCRRACRGHSRSQGHGDESGRAGCLRAGHQRGRGAASLSRHSRSRARSVGRSPTRGRRSTEP